jgi:hypothetical protein
LPKPGDIAEDYLSSPLPSNFNGWIKSWIVFVLHVCIRQGWLAVTWFQGWCCEYVLDWWEVIPTVSLAMGIQKISTYLSVFAEEARSNVMLCV